jgi:mannose-6-phosphate isomerase-like protein (cupin superfamily)
MATSDPEALRQFTILPGGGPRTGPTWKLPGSRLTALITDGQRQGKLAIFEKTMGPNGGVPLHINHREDEWFYVVEGKYLFEISGILNELRPGVLCLCSSGYSTPLSVHR